MSNKQVLRIKKRLTGHMFLPQEMVRCEVWIGDLQRRHNYKRRSPWTEMHLNTHPNEWVEYTYQPQYVV
jgi:hypothetical protein